MTVGLATATTERMTGKRPGLAPLPKLYEVLVEAGGEIRIPHVPILPEHKRVLPDGTVIDITVGWLKQNAVDMRRLQAEGMTSPIHLGHIDWTTKAERPAVGRLMDPTVELVQFEGRPTWMTFADLLLDGPKDLAKINPKYRFRSVEIHDPQKPMINGLALLQSRPSWFRLPNLELNKTQVEAALDYEAVGGGVVFAFAEPLQFSSEGNVPPTTTPTESDMSDQIKALATKIDQLLAVFMPPTQAAATAPVMQAGAAPVAPLQASAAPQLGAFGTLPGTPNQLIDPNDDAAWSRAKAARKARKSGANGSLVYEGPNPVGVAIAAPAPARGLVTPLPGVAPAPISLPVTPATGSDPVLYAATMAALTKAQEITSAAIASSKVRDEVFAWAERELETRPVPALRDMLKLHYESGGRPAVEAIVATFKAALPALPGPNAHADAGTRAPGGQDTPKEVLAYSSDPEKFAFAKGIHALWERRPASDQHEPLSLWLNAQDELVTQRG